MGGCVGKEVGWGGGGGGVRVVCLNIYWDQFHKTLEPWVQFWTGSGKRKFQF
jgi:hypothetical protein